MKAKKRFGQHFLANGRIADRIADFAGITPDDRVLEIGPGNGILTECLLARTPHVTAVEIDRDLYPLLEERFGGRGSFRLVRGDILTTDLAELFHDAPGRIKVVSNLPYNISSPVVELLIRHRSRVSLAVLMVQREVARRFAAAPGSREYGLLSLNLGLWTRVRVLFDVRPGSFSPPPAVMSSVVYVEFDAGLCHEGLDEDLFRDLTGVAFRQRRKMVRNTLVPFIGSKTGSNGDGYAMLEAAGIDPSARPEAVPVGDFVRLTMLAAERIHGRGR